MDLLPGTLDLLVLRIPHGAVMPRLPGAKTAPLSAGARVAVWPFPAWQDTEAIRLCIDPDGPGPRTETCHPLGWTRLHPRSDEGLSPWAYLGLPEIVDALVNGEMSERAVVRYERPIRPVGPDAARLLLLVPAPPHGCWRIDGVDGLPSTRLGPGVVRVERDGDATGVLRFSRHRDPRGCVSATDELSVDPAVIELPTDADIPGWTALLAKYGLERRPPRRREHRKP